MMITPIANFRYSSPAFSGKKPTGPKNEDENKNSKSSQNNAQEIYISPETYATLMGIGLADKMEEKGMFDPDSEYSKRIDALAEAMPDDEYGFGFDGEDGFIPDAMLDMAVDSSIFSIKASAEILGQIPDEFKGKVPVFVDFGADDFIKSMEKNLEEQENVDYSAIQPDYDAIEDELAKLGRKEREGVEELLETTLDFLNDETQMEQMFAMQRNMIEKFKGEKKPELADALKSLSEYTNYMFFRAINAGFKGDARSVVNALCSDMTSRTLPKTEDLGNGTTLSKYNEMFSEVDVVRDKATGDYISAVMKKNGKDVCTVDFKKDGSIKKLAYNNTTDNSLISMATNDRNDRILVEQTSQSGICQRVFKKQPNGELKQISCQIKVFL